MEVRVEWVIEMIAVLMGALNRLLAAFVPAHQVIQAVSASHTVKGFILLRGRCVGGSEGVGASCHGIVGVAPSVPVHFAPGGAQASGHCDDLLDTISKCCFSIGYRGAAAFR